MPPDPLTFAAQLTCALSAAGKLEPRNTIPFFKSVVHDLNDILSGREAGPRDRNAAPGSDTAIVSTANPVPALPPEKSITPDRLICLEDGVPRKMLRRYLRVKHNLTPEEYRAKWGLPSDYPMVAPRTRTQRSAAAKLNGLGTHDRNRSAP